MKTTYPDPAPSDSCSIKKVCAIPQVKIWFQNRRAKERKVNKKKQQQQQPLPPSQLPLPLDDNPTPSGPPLSSLCPTNAGLLGTPSPVPVKEEFLP